MGTNDYAPAWRWADDGQTCAGVVTDVRQVDNRFRPGTTVTVLDVDTDAGRRAVWMDNAGLRRFADAESPGVGDHVTLTRASQTEFTLGDGTAATKWNYETAIVRDALPAADVSTAGSRPTSDDDDIPFSMSAF